MNKSKKFLLVTWDFTELSDYALQHAIKISRMIDTQIRLIHILSRKESPESEIAKQKKLQLIVEKNNEESDIDTSWVILRGNIFNEISEYASDNRAFMVIMGTHGIQGSQKVFGSWALKVIMGSKVPFLVIQDKPKDWEKYQNIVFPVDYRLENREKLKMAIFMGKYFDSRIHILKQDVSDRFLRKKLNITMNFAVKYLIQNNISYEIHEIMHDEHLGKKTMEFAADINADLIIIMVTRKFGPAIGVFEQYIIANSARIPVLCINPRSSFVRVGSFQFG
ncbi:MAG TPA: universal stress protein [Bacteroidetes bacterium]|nr:universal stress protein [Bacteroidota bacterium]